MMLFATDTTGTIYDTDLLDLITESEPTVPDTTPAVADGAVPATTPGKLTFVATLSTGAIEVRSSASMPYTHVLERWDIHGSERVAWSWHQTAAAAAKAAARFPDTQVHEVTAYPYSSPQAKAARAAAGRKA